MKSLKFYLACAACALSIPASAQTTPTNPALTAAQINQLIQVAVKDNGRWSTHTPGLHMNDVWAGIQAMGDKTGQTGSGFSADIYTAPSWIEHQASLSIQMMKPFTAADVTPDMERDVIRVVAYPSTARMLTGPGLADASNVTHVVMEDATKKIVIQPISETVLDQTLDSAVRSASVHGQVAVFAESDVSRIRGTDGKGEFYVAVLGDNRSMSRKEFKVKSKDFDKLIGQ